MDLNEFYTISFKDYKNILKFRLSDISLLDRLKEPNNDITLRIYDNKKLIYRITIFRNIISRVYKGNGNYVKFEMINIKKEILKDSLKLLDSEDSLNHILFLEIFKLKLNEIT